MMRGSLSIAVAALCACTAASPDRTLAVPIEATTAPSPSSCKPEAPIAVTLASRPLQLGRYELTVTATPTKAVDSIELALVLPSGAQIDRPRAWFGPTAARAPRVLVAVVETSSRTTEVSALARVPVVASTNEPPIMMSRSTTIALGDPKPAPRTRVYALPDGDRAKEVRP
jgi:hypothetical protein